MYKYALFDLDGTLTDPVEGITNSIIYALGEMKREIPPMETLKKFIGPPLIESFELYCGMDEAEAREALRLYRVYFAERGLLENEVYPDIPALLARLKGAGVRLIVATSKPTPYAARILEHFRLAGMFESICGASMDEKLVAKKDIIRYALDKNGIKSTSECVMVGDRLHDVMGARENGIKSVGVLWGYGDENELRESGADYIAADTEELYSIIMK